MYAVFNIERKKKKKKREELSWSISPSRLSLSFSLTPRHSSFIFFSSSSSFYTFLSITLYLYVVWTIHFHITALIACRSGWSAELIADSPQSLREPRVARIRQFPPSWSCRSLWLRVQLCWGVPWRLTCPRSKRRSVLKPALQRDYGNWPIRSG